MTREDIIKLALEAGIVVTGEAVWKLCELVAAHEREACAQVCIEQSARWYTDQRDVYVAHECAAAIRARGEKK